jgi:hypothetical protein
MGSYDERKVTALETLASSATGSGEIIIRPQGVVLASTGAPLAEFTDGASATPGLDLVDSKTWAVRWNNHATPTAVAFNAPVPYDLDPSLPATFIATVSKTGATVGDATTLTVAAYLAMTGQLHDADADFGGATGALVGNATAKTISTLTRTFSAANLTAQLGAVPIASTQSAVLAVSFGPTAGLLGTDDFLFHGGVIRYSKKKPSA